MPRYPEPIPLDEALAAIDGFEAVADRRKRAQKWAEELEGDARGHMFALAGWKAVYGISEPFRTQNRISGAALEAAERDAGRRADAVVFEQCMIALRAHDVAAVYADPDRMEAERVWQPYSKQVTAVAWAQGNKEAAFIANFRDLIAERRDAEEYDDANAIRRIDARLERLVGVPYPVLPEAAWIAADTLSEPEREVEHARLEAKYGPRNPDENHAGPKTSRRPRLSTRPLALETR